MGFAEPRRHGMAAARAAAGSFVLCHSLLASSPARFVGILCSYCVLFLFNQQGLITRLPFPIAVVCAA